MPTGTATVDFGAAPGGNYAFADIDDQADIQSTSHAEAWMMAESSADHNATEHMIAPIKLTCGDVTPSVGFRVHAVCEWRLTGTFKVRWVWAD